MYSSLTRLLLVLSQVKTSEFYRYSRQLRQEVDQALSYFHDVNQQPLVETRANRIRSVRPQTAVFRGMIGHSMVNSKILLLQRPKVRKPSTSFIHHNVNPSVRFCQLCPLCSNPPGVVGAGGTSGAAATRLPRHCQQLCLPAGRRGAGPRWRVPRLLQSLPLRPAAELVAPHGGHVSAQVRGGALRTLR